MQNYKKYLWLLPALYVAVMFGAKIIEGLSGSQELIDIISVIALLKPYASILTPLVGVLDFCIGAALILNPFTLKKSGLQKFLFVWTALWPFVPATLRVVGGVGEFEIAEVLSISTASIIAYVLWSSAMAK